MFVRNRQDSYLLGSQPDRKIPGEVFNQSSAKTLDRTQRSTMDHHRSTGNVVLPYVDQPEAFWQVVVHLNCAQLPLAPNNIAYDEIDLGAVKSGLTELFGSMNFNRARRTAKGLFRLFPLSNRSNVFG